MNNLESKQREVLQLRKNGMTFVKICEKVEMPVGWVKAVIDKDSCDNCKTSPVKR